MFIWYCGPNVFFPNSYAEALTPNVMVFGDGVFSFGVGLIASSRNDVWCQDVTPVDSALTRRMPRRFFCWCLYRRKVTELISRHH